MVVQGQNVRNGRSERSLLLFFLYKDDIVSPMPWSVESTIVAYWMEFEHLMSEKFLMLKRDSNPEI